MHIAIYVEDGKAEFLLLSEDEPTHLLVSVETLAGEVWARRGRETIKPVTTLAIPFWSLSEHCLERGRVQFVFDAGPTVTVELDVEFSIEMQRWLAFIKSGETKLTLSLPEFLSGNEFKASGPEMMPLPRFEREDVVQS